MQIPSLISSISKEIICGSLCLFVLAFVFVKTVALITGSHILGLLLLVFGLYRLLRLVGIFALYPGCFNFIKSDYELRGSQRLGQQIVKCNQQLFTLLQKCEQYPDTAYLAPAHYAFHVKNMVEMLEKFEPTLSEAKKGLLRIYRSIAEILKRERNVDDFSLTFEDLISNPQAIRQRLQQKNGNSAQLKSFTSQFIKELGPQVKQLNEKLHFFHPPHGDPGMVKMFFYRLYSQKLYQIRFGYMYWQTKFEYKIHQVQSKESDAVIECAVMAGPKGKPLEEKRCVIICCPNGAYLQYFALESQYIEMYFQMGYQVVLWNYRGYGQSTGSPTISGSIIDAQSVYNYCVRVLKLDPQIAHGYSIGGPPAAVLALSNPLKVVVIDRSFCNFVNIAHEISPVLAKLAKLVMKSDSSVNISDVYLRIRNCRKILIWSAVDEVISNGSSLKLGVLNKLFNETLMREEKHDLQPNSPTALISESELHEREVFIEKKRVTSRSKKVRGKISMYANWLQKMQEFFQTVSSLYQVQKMQEQAKSSQNTTNSLVEQLPVETELRTINAIPSQRRELSKQLLSQFWRIVGHIDGGGTTVQFLRELAAGGVEKHQELNLEIRSFVLGLVYFGCCYHQSGLGMGRLNVDNLDNWPETINCLQEAEQKLATFIGQNQSKGLDKLLQYFKQIQQIFKEIRVHIQKTNPNNDRALGIILPTQSGHNGELSRMEGQYLRTALKFKLINGKDEGEKKEEMQMKEEK